MLYMLDTNILTDLLKNHPKLLARVRSLEAGESMVISNIAWYEVVRGRVSAILTAEDGERLLLAQSRLDHDLRLLKEFPEFGITTTAAQHFEKLLKDKKCRKIRRPDLLIACIALAHKAVLVTRNVKDFANVPGLTLQNWFV